MEIATTAKTLLEHKLIADGQEIWLHPNVLPGDLRRQYNAADTRYRVTLDLSQGKPRFRWSAGPEEPDELLSPSLAWFSIVGAIFPGRYTNPLPAQVYDHYSLEPDGPTLGQIAVEEGVW